MGPVVVAAATPWGYGALAVVRFSGAGLDAVLQRVVTPWPLPGGRPRRVELRDAGGVFDDAVIVIGRAPATYTGEDTAEITCHGNPLIVERLLAAATHAGARVAGPGEFTRRAFTHGKIDLLRAEAVLQVSRARSSRGLDVGRGAFNGSLGRFVTRLRDALREATAELEARLDHPGDELARLDDEELAQRLSTVVSECRGVADTHRVGQHLVEGARVALVGPVNAGKSSLFNALLGRVRALVHHEPGTTRDVLEVSLALGPVVITLLDTAGERPTADPVEAAGLALSRELVEGADLLLVVVRAGPDAPGEVARAILARTAGQRRVVVYNGVDRADAAPPPPGSVSTVAVTGAGVDQLVQAIVEALVGELPGGSRLLIASARQRDLLIEVAEHTAAAIQALPVAGPAVAADELTAGLEAIDALTGEHTREAVLDTLFARFCIGK